MSAEDVPEWKVPEADFPASAGPGEQLAFMVRYAVLAPSGHNTQPWRFVQSGERLELFADRSRSLPAVDPEGRELMMSCGAALFFLKLALRHFGYAGAVELLPRSDAPDLLARVELGARQPALPSEERLFAAIPRRHTHRQPFEPRPLPEPLLQELATAAREEGAWLRLVEPANREAVAVLVAEGDRLQSGNAPYRRELAAWMRPNLSPRKDGLRGHGFGVPDPLSYALPWLLRTFNLGSVLAVTNRKAALAAPLLAVLGTDEDTPRAWLMAGQAVARVLLQARAEDVWASFLNQPIQVPVLRPRLAAVLGQSGHPQLLLRMGFGHEVRRPAPRRPYSEVLSHSG